jgi:hypothetical protein
MTNIDTNSAELVTAGGFRIEIRPEELLVNADRTAFDRNAKKRNWMLFVLWVVFIFVPNLSLFTTLEFPHSLSSLRRMPTLLFTMPPEQQALRWFCSLLVLAILIVSLLLASWRGQKTLRCTPDHLEIIHAFHGRIRRRQSFAKSEVKSIQYDEGTSIISANSGRLRFIAGKRNYQCLLGLKSLEAQRILDELRKMGFDAIRDPALPMMLEMEQSRRKHPFRLFP